MTLQALNPKTTALVIVDVQERLAPAMEPAQLAALERAARVLVAAAARLGVATAYTEQYPKGLGATLPWLADALAAAQAARFEKLAFSAVKEGALVPWLQTRGVRDVVLLGMETHVCVFQTARDLALAGFLPWLAVDGVASRREDHRQAGLRLAERAGAVSTTAESVLFDWLERAGTDEFRELSKLVR